MARTYGTLTNSAPLSSGTGVNKTILQYTPPANTAAAVVPTNITFDGTNAAANKVRVDVIRGATGGSGSSARTVTAKGSNNPASALLGTGAEAFGTEPTGGTVIDTYNLAPYGSFPIPLGEIVLAPGETLGIRVNAPAAVNVTAGMKVEC